MEKDHKHMRAEVRANLLLHLISEKHTLQLSGI